MTTDLSIFGYFTSPTETKPTFDPGLDVPCPVCLTELTLPVKTISLMPVNDDRSWFFRAHKECWENASKEEQQRIEGSLIDSRPT